MLLPLLLQHLMETANIGFTVGILGEKSPGTALLETTHICFEMLENGTEVGAVFLEFRKEFLVPHCVCY